MNKLVIFFIVSIIMRPVLLAGITAKPSFLERARYNPKQSLLYNEGQFLKNLNSECKSFGYNAKLKSKIAIKGNTSAEILSSYPKELSIMYLKKHYKTMCYYGVSTVIKFLHGNFKLTTQKILEDIITLCVKKRSSVRVCNSFNLRPVLYDLTVMLGSFCNKSSLKAFKMINCEFKKLVDSECTLYKNESNPLVDCPYGHSGRSLVDNLHKSFYGIKCRKRRLRWRKPKCLR